MSTAKKIVLIAGPTASGKSALALQLALEANGIIINADSMQVYKDIPILSAAPTKKETDLVEHKLYGIYDASVRGNVSDWLDLALKEINSALSHQQIPIVIGGTGMYIETLEKGASPIPETPEEIRQKVSTIKKTEGLKKLYQLLLEIDEQTALRIGPNDTTRITRAMEIWYHTKKNISYWQTIPLKKYFSPETFVHIYINPPRNLLNERIDKRFDIMIKNGACDEVKALVARNLSDSLPAMRALGVQELKAYIEQQCSLDEAVSLAKTHTHQYAKRQSTWFNNRFKADFCYTDKNVNNKIFVDDIKKKL